MQLWDSLPTEIISIIYEFDGDKRSKLHACLADIQMQGCFSRIRKLEEILVERRQENVTSFDEVIYEFLDDPELIMTRLSSCRCCVRHIVNRPCCFNCQRYQEYRDFQISHMNYVSRERVLDLDERYSGNGCLCPCRHVCRILYDIYSL